MDLVSARLGYEIQLSRLIFRTLWSQRQFLISWACWPVSYWSYPRRLAPLNMTCFHLQAFMQTKVIYDFSLFLLFKKADFYPNWEFWPQVCGLNHWDNILPNMFLRTILKFFPHISRFLGSLLKKLDNMIRRSLHFRLKPVKWELHPQQSTAVTVTLQGKAAPTMSSEVNMKGCLSTPVSVKAVWHAQTLICGLHYEAGTLHEKITSDYRGCGCKRGSLLFCFVCCFV